MRVGVGEERKVGLREERKVGLKVALNRKGRVSHRLLSRRLLSRRLGRAKVVGTFNPTYNRLGIQQLQATSRQNRGRQTTSGSQRTPTIRMPGMIRMPRG